MANRIVEQPFGEPRFPRRIEDDPMFKGWGRELPRLWYLEQRQATRLDAESLYGAQEFAVFYSRAQFTVLSAPVQSTLIASRGYSRVQVTALPVPIQSVDRTVNYIRTQVTELTLEQDTVLVRPSSSPISPPVHPIPDSFRLQDEFLVDGLMLLRDGQGFYLMDNVDAQTQTLANASSAPDALVQSFDVPLDVISIPPPDGIYMGEIPGDLAVHPLDASRFLGGAQARWNFADRPVSTPGDPWPNAGVSPGLDLVAKELNDNIRFGGTGGYLSVPHTAAFNITGDLDVRARVAGDPPTQTRGIIGKSGAWTFFQYFSGLGVTIGASAIIWNPFSPPHWVIGQPYWVRFTRQVSTGRIRFYWAPGDENVEPTSWYEIDPQGFNAGLTTYQPGVNNPTSTNPILIGGTLGAGSAYKGNFFNAVVRNGIDGPVVFSMNTGNDLSGSLPSSFVVTSGHTATVVGTGLTYDATYWEGAYRTPVGTELDMAVGDDLIAWVRFRTGTLDEASSYINPVVLLGTRSTPNWDIEPGFAIALNQQSRDVFFRCTGVQNFVGDINTGNTPNLVADGQDNWAVVVLNAKRASVYLWVNGVIYEDYFDTSSDGKVLDISPMPTQIRQLEVMVDGLRSANIEVLDAGVCVGADLAPPTSMGLHPVVDAITNGGTPYNDGMYWSVSSNGSPSFAEFPDLSVGDLVVANGTAFPAELSFASVTWSVSKSSAKIAMPQGGGNAFSSLNGDGSILFGTPFTVEVNEDILVWVSFVHEDGGDMDFYIWGEEPGANYYEIGMYWAPDLPFGASAPSQRGVAPVSASVYTYDPDYYFELDYPPGEIVSPLPVDSSMRLLAVYIRRSNNTMRAFLDGVWSAPVDITGLGKLYFDQITVSRNTMTFPSVGAWRGFGWKYGVGVGDTAEQLIDSVWGQM